MCARPAGSILAGDHRPKERTMAIASTHLSDLVAGRVVVPGDDDWDTARQAFDLLVDLQPYAVAFPVDERDVVSIVSYARERGLRIAPQATGHNAGPLGSLDGTILVSTSRLTGVSIDAPARRVRVGTATKWEHVAPQLSELGLAGLHGSSPDVGIAGYSLGGGMGWLARKHGLQTNSVTAIELVTADGHLVRTDAVHEPDLFWALRGGGGNFGVVTAIEFDVYPVEQVYAGTLLFPLERAGELWHAWRELLPTLPDELMTWASVWQFPDLPQVPAHVRGGSFAILMGAFLGSEADGRELLRPVRELGPDLDTFALGPPGVLGSLALEDWLMPLPFMSAHRLLGELPAAAVDDLVAAGARPGSPLGLLQLRHLGGALARKPPGAGARATLPGEVQLFAVGVATDEAAARAIGATLEAVDEAVRPYHAGYYPNFVEHPADASTFFDPETWARLRQVKALYDPQDVFKGNHHIPPAERP
jgi:FAD/FMN-containing dehydrogenase